MKYNINYEKISANADKLKNGRKFKEICEALNLPVIESKHSKNSIIQQLKQYCDIQEIKEEGRRPYYKITQIYSQPLVDTIHKNNKFQEYIEQAILTKCLNENQSRPMFLSNLEILYLTALVNKNFHIICNEKLANQLIDREWLHTEAYTIYSILFHWLKERLKQMNARHIIELQRGYRVYKTFINEKGQEIVIKQNVNKGSALERKCQEVFASAIRNTHGVPFDWKGEWLAPNVYSELKRQIRIFAKQLLAEDGWDNVKTVNVIVPVQNKELLADSLKNVEQILNNESKRKIKATRQLNYLSGFEREIAIDELIDIHTKIDYKQLLDSTQ